MMPVDHSWAARYLEKGEQVRWFDRCNLDRYEQFSMGSLDRIQPDGSATSAVFPSISTRRLSSNNW